MSVATRPTTRPSASIRCHFFSTSAGRTDLVVFISAFMGCDLFVQMNEAPPERDDAAAGAMIAGVVFVKQSEHLLTGIGLPDLGFDPFGETFGKPVDRPDGDRRDVIAVQFGQ